MRPPHLVVTMVVVCALIYQFDGLHVRVRTVGSDGRLSETYREVKVDWLLLRYGGAAPEIANQWRDSLLHSALTASFIGREQVAVPANGLGLFVADSGVHSSDRLLAGFMALAVRKRYSEAAADK